MESFKCKRCEADFRDGPLCSICHGRFDFPCSGITESGYRKLGDRKTSWKCPSCKSAAGSPLLLHPSGKSLKSPVPADLESIALDLKRLSAQISTLPDLMETVKEIKADIADLKTLKTDLADTIEALAGRISDVSEVVEDLRKSKNEVSLLQQRVDQLEHSARDFDQRARMNNIEIKGVPVAQSENLFEVVGKIGNRIGCIIAKEQINYIARVPMKNDKKNKSILLSVHNRYVKEDFVAAAKKHSIVSLDLGLRGDNRIYVNDHLTLANKMLLNKTKNIAKDKGFAYVWVKGCKIFARKNPTSIVLNIKSESDLVKIS